MAGRRDQRPDRRPAGRRRPGRRPHRPGHHRQPGERAGLLVGDVVVGVDGTAVDVERGSAWSLRRRQAPPESCGSPTCATAPRRVAVATLVDRSPAPDPPTTRSARPARRVPHRRSGAASAAVAAAEEGDRPHHQADQAGGGHGQGELLAPPGAHVGQRPPGIGLDVDLVVAVAAAPSRWPAAGRWPPPRAGGRRTRPRRRPARPDRARSWRPPATQPAGRCSRPTGPASSARASRDSQPSGATLKGPSRRWRRAWSMAAARSSRCRNCEGRSAPLARRARADHGDSASQAVDSAAT